MKVHTESVRLGGMPAHVARPDDGAPAPAVLVIMEAFGLNRHIKAVAERVAAEGYVTLAPDLYWRGGAGRTAGYDQLNDAIGMMSATKDAELVADVASAIGFLEQQAYVRADRIGITGFCMGGRVSYLAACELPTKIKAVAPFYGGALPIDKTAKLRAPVLAFFGSDDQWIPPAVIEQLKQEAAQPGKQVEVVVYPGAPHGFFCNERDSYRAEAAQDAWGRLTKFLAAHLKK